MDEEFVYVDEEMVIEATEYAPLIENVNTNDEINP